VNCPDNEGKSIVFAVFRNRNFALLWTAGLISMIGDWTLRIGIPVYIYRMTGSTLATGALMVVGTVHGLLFGSIAGVFADHWDRRRTMIVANVLMALSLLPLLVQSLDQLWIVYVVLFAEATLAQFFIPAERALLPLLVGVDDLAAANTMNALNGNLARLLGPSLGGLVVAAGSLSAIAVIDAVSFLVAAGLIVLVTYRRQIAEPIEAARASIVSTWRKVQREWREGFAYVQRKPRLGSLLVIGGITAIGEGFIGTLIVPFVTEVMHGTESDYGYLMAAQAVGGILGSLFIARIAKRVAPQRLLAVCAILFGIFDLILFYYPLFLSGTAPGLVLIALVGIPAIGFGTGFMTLMQTLSEDAYRGRVFGMFGALSALLLLVGAVLSGVLGQYVSIIALLTVQGAGYVVAGVLAFVLLQKPEVEMSVPAVVSGEA
jgi:predicted MFS family arabinose efflux permease